MPEMLQLHAWLQAHIPAGDGDAAATRISHGDYRWAGGWAGNGLEGRMVEQHSLVLCPEMTCKHVTLWPHSQAGHPGAPTLRPDPSPVLAVLGPTEFTEPAPTDIVELSTSGSLSRTCRLDALVFETPPGH